MGMKKKVTDEVIKKIAKKVDVDKKLENIIDNEKQKINYSSIFLNYLLFSA